MKRFRDLSLTVKLNIALITLLAAIFAFSFIWMRREVRNLLTGEISRTAQMSVELAARKINAGFPVVATGAAEFASVLETLEPDEADMRRMLERTYRQLKTQVPALCGISIAYPPDDPVAAGRYFMLDIHEGPAGELRVVRLGGPGYQYDKFDWFVLPKLLGRSIWTEPYFDTYARLHMTTWSQLIRKPDGQFRGVVGFDLSLAGLGRMVKDADAYGYGEEFLLSRFGRFAVFPGEMPAEAENDWLETTEAEAPPLPAEDRRHHVYNTTIFSMADAMAGSAFSDSLELSKLRRVGKAMLAGETGHARLGLLSRERDEAQWLYFAPCSTPGWSVGVIYPEKMLMKQLDQLEWQIGSLAVLGILMMVLTVAVINRRFSHPLVRLAGVAQSIGSGNFNTPVPAVRGLDEIGRLSSAFHSMQHELKRYVDELQENTAIRQKIESELEVARQIQRSILPAMLPPLPETPEFSLFALLRPARAVGGDLYDFFFLDEFHWCFIIGDVSGKGVPAALFMAVTQTLQRSESEKQHSPGALISRINNLLVRNNDSMMFVTYFLGVLDIRTGEVEYTNAGHNPPYILQGCGELKLLNTRHGTALGVVENQEYGSSRITLEEGDALVLYTDGVVEAMNPEFHEFGAGSLRQVLARDRGLEPRIIGGDIVAAVDRFADGAEQADDITLLVLKYRKNGIAAG